MVLDPSMETGVRDLWNETVFLDHWFIVQIVQTRTTVSIEWYRATYRNEWSNHCSFEVFMYQYSLRIVLNCCRETLVPIYWKGSLYWNFGPGPMLPIQWSPEVRTMKRIRESLVSKRSWQTTALFSEFPKYCQYCWSWRATEIKTVVTDRYWWKMFLQSCSVAILDHVSTWWCSPNFGGFAPNHLSLLFALLSIFWSCCIVKKCQQFWWHEGRCSQLTHMRRICFLCCQQEEIPRVWQICTV